MINWIDFNLGHEKEVDADTQSEGGLSTGGLSTEGLSTDVTTKNGLCAVSVASLPRVPSQDTISVDTIGATSSTGDLESVGASNSFTHVLQKDAYLVFRSLCRLAMKPLPDGIPDPK